MTDDRALVSIGIAGPRGVGKTSLIASILKSGNEALITTSVSLSAATPRAAVRINKFHDQLAGWLMSGGFVGDGLKPTADVDELPFQLTIQGDAELGIRFDVMDYPGSLLTATDHSADRKRVDDHLFRSTILIVPVDAACVMEAVEPTQKSGLPGAVYLAAVESRIIEWAKARRDRSDEPAILVIVPVKCETYLSDNGGRLDESTRLRADIMNLFDETVQGARAAVGDAEFEVWYCPVDTIGCIEIESARWKSEGDIARLDVDFVVRPPGKRKPRGAQSVLQLVADHIVKAQRRLSEHESQVAKDKAKTDAKRAAQDRGWFGNIWWSINGTRSRLNNDARMSKEEADIRATKVKAIEHALEKLATLPDEGRLSRVE